MYREREKNKKSMDNPGLRLEKIDENRLALKEKSPDQDVEDPRSTWPHPAFGFGFSPETVITDLRGLKSLRVQ